MKIDVSSVMGCVVMVFVMIQFVSSSGLLIVSIILVDGWRGDW